MVLFDLHTLRGMADDTSVRGMFYLPQSTDLDLHSHVILTSQGTLAASLKGSRLVDPLSETVFPAVGKGTSLYERFSDRFDLFPSDDVDCLAIGEMAPFPPVLLHLRAEHGVGEAKAVFAREPSTLHYELLKAIGVEYLGGNPEGAHYVARFRNHLPTHIHSGVLAHFARTSHCNMFFFRHGSIDRPLERGLISASTNRVSWGAGRAREAVVRMANEAEGEDAVSLGFLLRALNHHTSAASIFDNIDTRTRLVSLLRDGEHDSLWPYEVGGPASSTASAIVLQGLYDPTGVEALEAFADGRGGYYSRLPADQRETASDPANSGDGHHHPDFATACMIRALRNGAGLDTRTGVEYLATRFEGRSGLCFANPYLVDWALASALENDDSAQELRNMLTSEILASMNDDYSFGRFDVPLSSAFAICSLASLGFRSRTLRLAQLRLLDFMQPDGTFPTGTPLFSVRADTREPGRGPRDVFLRADRHGTISTAAGTLALLAACSAEEGDPYAGGEWGGGAHPRYGCRDHEEYIRRFVLPPDGEGSS
jgi:hypothetical protein